LYLKSINNRSNLCKKNKWHNVICYLQQHNKEKIREEQMELSEEDIKTIAASLMKASDSSETEWLKIEKIIIESYPLSKNENGSSIIREKWNQLHQKIFDSMERTKILGNVNG
jgi:hypothetical protein